MEDFIKLGKELSHSWDIQGGIGYNRASEHAGISGVSGRYKQTTLSVDALYMFSRDKFRPFLLAGLGVAHNYVDYSNYPVLDHSSNTSWMANVGLGAYIFSATSSVCKLTYVINGHVQMLKRPTTYSTQMVR